MSMISAQIDELRRMADGQVTYRDARAVMLQAADTIWQLCDDLQQANAENAKLRELVRDMWRFEQMSCSKCVAKNDGYCGIGIDEECPLEHSIYDRMRELGVEVDA